MGRRLLEAGWRPIMENDGRRLARARPPAGAPAPSRTLRTRAAEAMRCHLDPAPRLELGGALRARGIATAAMDLSDGLALDGWRLARASGVGLVLMEPALPIADAARALSSVVGTTPLDLALHGGEDYELLFTLPASLEGSPGGLQALVVGHVVRKPIGVVLEDPRGRRRRLRPAGFDHFAADADRRV
jgi:thiamine-monophosphate kinase